MTALEMRRAQARQALYEQADLTDRQLDEIDAAVDGMNADLEVLAEGVCGNGEWSRWPRPPRKYAVRS